MVQETISNDRGGKNDANDVTKREGILPEVQTGESGEGGGILSGVRKEGAGGVPENRQNLTANLT